MEDRKRQNLFVYLIIIALSFILYGNSIPNDYALDDFYVISKNTLTTSGLAGIGDILSHDTSAGLFSIKGKLSLAGGRYRPLSVVTFAIETEFFGLNPHISHIINILLYAITGVLIYIILLRLLPLCKGEERFSSPCGREYFGNTLPCNMKYYLSVPFLTAILFIAHPIHTEVIANIKGRDEIMAFLGSLLALLFTLNYLESRKKRYLIYSLAAFFLALMSKENAITFVAIIPITVYFFTGHAIRRNLSAFTPIILATAAYLIIRQVIIGGHPSGESIKELMNNPFLHASIAEKYATILYTLGIYLKLLIFPHPLTFDYYPHHIPIIGPADPKAIIPLIIYILLSIYSLTTIKKKGIFSYCILYYLVTLSVSSNIFFPIGAFMAERFAYIPSLGFCLVVAYLICYLLPKYIKNPAVSGLSATLVIIIILPLYAYKTITRNMDWKDNFTLFSADVKTSAGSAKVNLYMAKEFFVKAFKTEDAAQKNQYYESALKHAHEALKIYPEFDHALLLIADTHTQYDKNYDLAIEYFEKLFKLNPNISKVNAEIGKLYLEQKKNPDKALFYFEKAFEINPDNSFAANNIGVIYFSKKDYPRALEMFKKAATLEPQDGRYLKNVGKTYTMLGNNEEAEEYFNQADKLQEKEDKIE